MPLYQCIYAQTLRNSNLNVTRSTNLRHTQSVDVTYTDTIHRLQALYRKYMLAIKISFRPFTQPYLATIFAFSILLNSMLPFSRPISYINNLKSASKAAENEALDSNSRMGKILLQFSVRKFSEAAWIT